MDNLIYISATGASENLNSLAVRANNIANANTPGFKKALEQARAMPVFGEGLPTRAFAMTEVPVFDLTSGPMMSSSSDLDIAIKNQGFFTVINKNGEERLSRFGSFFLDVDGFLKDKRGNFVIGSDGKIAIPLGSKDLSINKDGMVLFRDAASNSASGKKTVAGTLKLVNADFRNVYKKEDGMFVIQDEALHYSQNFNKPVQLVSNFLEGSNVNPISEMVRLVQLQRQFDMQLKMISTAKTIEQSGMGLMQV